MSCPPPPADYTQEQLKARQWAVPTLVIAVVSLISFVFVVVTGGLAGILGCVAASLVVCCAPMSSEFHEAPKYTAAGILAIITAVLDASGIIWCFVAMGLYFGDEDWGWGIFALIIALCNFAALCVHAFFAKTCFDAKNSLKPPGSVPAVVQVVSQPVVATAVTAQPVAVAVAVPVAQP